MSDLAARAKARLSSLTTRQKVGLGVTAGVLALQAARYVYHRSAKWGYYTSSDTALDGVDLSRKVAIVTGGNSGIGTATVQALAKHGAHVVLCSRSVQRGEKAKAEVEEALGAALKGTIEVMQLDLGSLASVRAFATAFVKRGLSLHLLVLNAGIMAVPEFRATAEGLESQFGVNHVGHFYLTRLLLDKLQQAAPARVVVVSSTGAMGAPNPFPEWVGAKLRASEGPLEAEYDPWKNYGIAKACNILFARELHRRYGAKGVSAMSLHPGAISTNLVRDMSKVRLAMMLLLIFVGGMEPVKSLDQGCATTCRGAALPFAELQGHYFRNCRDAEGELPAHLRENATAERQLWELTEKLITDKGFPLTM